MASEPDDDALSWEGDPADATTERPTLPEGWKAVGRGSEDVVIAGERPPMSTGMLVSLGAIGGVYLLYTVGWVLGGLRLQAPALFLIPGVMYQVTLWMAVVAPALWFAAAWALTRNARAWVRLAALLAGVLLLVPWPFVMGGGAA
ncbi:MAG: hypothetical protein WA971_12680 [Microbacterium sp.]